MTNESGESSNTTNATDQGYVDVGIRKGGVAVRDHTYTRPNVGMGTGNEESTDHGYADIGIRTGDTERKGNKFKLQKNEAYSCGLVGRKQ